MKAAVLAVGGACACTGGGETVQGIVAVAHRRDGATYRDRDRSACVRYADRVPREIIAVTDHGCGRRRCLGREPVQRVVSVGDRLPGPRPPGQDVIVGVVGEVFGAAARIGRGGEPAREASLAGEPLVGSLCAQTYGFGSANRAWRFDGQSQIGWSYAGIAKREISNQ